MKLLLYIALLFSTVTVYHLIVTGFGSFIMWVNFITLPFSEYKEGFRVSYLTFLTYLVAVLTFLYWGKK